MKTTLIIAGFIIISIALMIMKVPHKNKKLLAPGLSGPGNKTKGWWDDAGNKTLVYSLILIALSLVFVNWLCYLIGWSWWNVVWQKGSLFWAFQFSILFATLALMVAKKRAVKFFGLIVLATVIGGWVTTTWPGIAEKFKEKPVVPIAAPVQKVVVITLEPGIWSPKLDPKRIDSGETIPGQEMMINGNPKDVRPWVVGENKIPFYAKFVQVRATGKLVVAGVLHTDEKP